MRPFRFAVQCSVASSMTAWRELARRCESLGYSCLYIPDHFGNQFGPLVALTVAAEATTTLRVGSLVFDNDFRHPVVLAKEMATLDLASEGRLEVGLGAGWKTSDYEQSGMVFDPARVRVERMLEGLAVMKGLWSHERFSYTGTHYQVVDAWGLPRPHSAPHPPIVVGGGSRRILTIAATEADIVGVNPDLRAGSMGGDLIANVGADQFDARIGWVRTAAGERFDQLELQVLTFQVQVGKAQRAALEEAAPSYGVAPEVAAEIPIVLVGTEDEVCEQLLARRERWGFNYIVIHEPELDTFAPVVHRLAGT